MLDTELDDFFPLITTCFSKIDFQGKHDNITRIFIYFNFTLHITFYFILNASLIGFDPLNIIHIFNQVRFRLHWYLNVQRVTN